MHIKSCAQFHREPGKWLPSSGRRDIGGFAGAAPDRDRDILFQTGSVFPGGESVYDRAMPRPAKPALERIARTLCSRAGHPENIQFEGKTMWQSFLADAHAA